LEVVENADATSVVEQPARETRPDEAGATGDEHVQVHGETEPLAE